MNDVFINFVNWANKIGMKVDYEEKHGLLRWVAAPGDTWEAFQAGWDAGQEATREEYAPPGDEE